MSGGNKRRQASLHALTKRAVSSPHVDLERKEEEEGKVREVEEENRALSDRLQVQDQVKQVCVVGGSDTG